VIQSMEDHASSRRTGMIRRLSRIFRDDGRTLMIAADHRQRGIQAGIQNFGNLTSVLLDALGHADALVTTKEPMAHLIAHHGSLLRGRGLLLSLNRTGLAGSSFELDDRLVARPATALRWGLDGAKHLLRIDPERPETSDQLELCGRVCEECERLEMPMVLEPLYCSSGKTGLRLETAPDKVRYATIIANDFSVSALKIPYPDSGSRSGDRKAFRDIVDSASAPVLVLGGAQVAAEDLLLRAEDAMGEGASGMVVGRNVLLDPHPGAMACALKFVIHEEMDGERAIREAREVMDG
jgi:DhnA family fructose-bisphosphate aldolase class Ia